VVPPAIPNFVLHIQYTLCQMVLLAPGVGWVLVVVLVVLVVVVVVVVR
jgi:hypothetical protein